ncbi:hypothetical protein CASFOL_014538 [Castilleja foliolosa]|uniref:F-box domain-containing protein n=1 Tax=Castilleja foliolosa TaxID=1961234 RepID=A0ABD3DN55_9LAMI
MGKRGKKKLHLKRANGTKDNNPTAKCSTSAPPSPPWIDLPRDLTANILSRVGQVEILKTARKVCTTWRSVCSEPSMWRAIDLIYSDNFSVFDLALDLSEGELIDIRIIGYFGSNILLHYISERMNSLKRLTLGCCYSMYSRLLIPSVIKFPELEELHFFFMPPITAKQIEVIGIACPKLKSFTFCHKFSNVETDDSYALTIAKNMPNLHHLSLFGNRLSNEGLKAIFSGCPNLESLDLRECYNVDLSGDFGRICSKRIKCLKHPSDSTDDYEWDCILYDDYQLDR